MECGGKKYYFEPQGLLQEQDIVETNKLDCLRWVDHIIRTDMWKVLIEKSTGQHKIVGY